MRKYTNVFVNSISNSSSNNHSLISSVSKNPVENIVKTETKSTKSNPIKKNISKTVSTSKTIAHPKKKIIPLNDIFNLAIDIYNDSNDEEFIIDEKFMKLIAKKYKKIDLNEFCCDFLLCCCNQYIKDNPKF